MRLALFLSGDFYNVPNPCFFRLFRAFWPKIVDSQRGAVPRFLYKVTLLGGNGQKDVAERLKIGCNFGIKYKK